MSELSIFNFNSKKVRTTQDKNNMIWFIANDIAESLGYKNPRKAIADHVDKEDVTKRDTPTNSGIQSVTFINESGMYSLVLRSKKEEAKQFKRWVTSEVLPSIRKTGRYEIPQEGLTPEQQRHIQEAVSAIFIRDGIHYSTTYHNIKTEFRVGTYKDIPQEQYPALCRFLNIEPVHKTKDEPEPKVDLRQLSEFMNFTAERINHLSQAEYTMGKMLKSMQEMHQDMQEHRYKTRDLAFDLKVFANRLTA